MEMVRTFLPQISLLVLVAVIAVVMPTLYPISAEICQRFAGVNYVLLLCSKRDNDRRNEQNVLYTVLALCRQCSCQCTYGSNWSV